MKTFKATIKYEEDILDHEWGFHAKDQQEADRKIFGWNRYHGNADCPGYGYAIAVEQPLEEWQLKDSYVSRY